MSIEDANFNGLLQEPPIQTEGNSAARYSSSARLPSALEDLIANIESRSARELVTPIFTELACLLEYLKVIEECLLQNKTFKRTGVVFKIVHKRAVSVLDYINAQTTDDSCVEETLRDALEGTSFAITHELRRVFKYEVPQLNTAEYLHLSRAELTRAYGLLNNCFQQSEIIIAQVFNPEINGAHLFTDYEVKCEQSLLLYNELSALIEKVHRAETETGILLKHSLIIHLKHFREETMHLLMYKDWREFENFVDEISKIYDEMGDLAPVLHSFATYLETLLGHVSLRSVLTGQLESHEAAQFA